MAALLSIAAAAPLMLPALQPVEPPPSFPPLFAAPAAAPPSELEAFLADFHKDLKLEHPEMYRKKLEMAAQDDFRFSRVFPQLVYQKLKESSEAAKLAEAPE